MSRNGGARVGIDAPLTAGVLGNLSEFASDCSTLAELQAQLAALDAREAVRRAALPVVAAELGTTLLLAGEPVLMIGLAETLHALTALGRTVSYLIVAGLALLLGAGLAWFGMSGFGHVSGAFARSREVLTRNIAWVKTVLVHSGRS